MRKGAAVVSSPLLWLLYLLFLRAMCYKDELFVINNNEHTGGGGIITNRLRERNKKGEFTKSTVYIKCGTA